MKRKPENILTPKIPFAVFYWKTLGLFDEKILQDLGFAADLAFYLSTMRASKDSSATESRERFREISQSGKTVKMVPDRKINVRMPYFVAAAMLAAMFLGVFIWYKPGSTQELQPFIFKMSSNPWILQWTE